MYTLDRFAPRDVVCGGFELEVWDEPLPDCCRRAPRGRGGGVWELVEIIVGFHCHNDDCRIFDDREGRTHVDNTQGQGLCSTRGIEDRCEQEIEEEDHRGRCGKDGLCVRA
jgi:hypothetical protein